MKMIVCILAGTDSAQVPELWITPTNRNSPKFYVHVLRVHN